LRHPARLLSWEEARKLSHDMVMTSSLSQLSRPLPQVGHHRTTAAHAREPLEIDDS